MKAMILAAGAGIRLRPLTNKIPKALIEAGGRPMLERVIEKLKKAGISEIIINTHYLAEQIENFLKTKNNFGLKITISRENEILGTGGGLKKAAWFLQGNEPFALYNCDIYCDLDLTEMADFHAKSCALATLAVKKRESRSYLLFDERMTLKGLSREKKKDFISLAFSGIHIISPEIFQKMTEKGFFSIIDFYLRLIKAGEILKGFEDEKTAWFDMGSIEKLKKLNAFLRLKNE